MNKATIRLFALQLSPIPSSRVNPIAPMNTATIRLFTQPLSPIPSSRLTLRAGVLLAQSLGCVPFP